MGGADCPKGFRLAVNAFAGEADLTSADDLPNTATKNSKRKTNKAQKKKILLLERQVMGSNISEARANAKGISLDELLSLEALLALEDRRPMQPSRRRRRLAWALWLWHRPVDEVVVATTTHPL